MLLFLATVAFSQERPATGDACSPGAYSDYLVVLNDRVLAAGDAYASSIGNGYDVAESKRKGLVAVVTNTRAQVASLGDCQGETGLRDAVVGLTDFWDEMARNDLVTITGYLSDGVLADDEASSATAILSSLSSRGTTAEGTVTEAQSSFAARFGFTVAGTEPAEVPLGEPDYAVPAEPVDEYRPEHVSRDPSIFVRLHGGVGLDYLFDSGRRRDAYALGADVNVGNGFRLGGLYKHDLLGDIELQRAQLIVRYGLGSEGGKVITAGLAFFVDPGIALVPDVEFGADAGAEITLNAHIAERFGLGLFYRFDYGIWFPDGGVARESLGTWEVEPGMSMTVGI